MSILLLGENNSSSPSDLMRDSIMGSEKRCIDMSGTAVFNLSQIACHLCMTATWGGTVTALAFSVPCHMNRLQVPTVARKHAF